MGQRDELVHGGGIVKVDNSGDHRSDPEEARKNNHGPARLPLGIYHPASVDLALNGLMEDDEMIW